MISKDVYCKIYDLLPEIVYGIKKRLNLSNARIYFEFSTEDNSVFIRVYWEGHLKSVMFDEIEISQSIDPVSIIVTKFKNI